MKYIGFGFIGILLTLITITNCFYFYLETGQKRCFLEELEKHTLMAGKIDVTEMSETDGTYSKNPNLAVDITIDVSIRHWLRAQKCEHMLRYCVY